jgi:hypothetical protein
MAVALAWTGRGPLASRLAATANILQLECVKTQYSLRPSALARRLTLADPKTGILVGDVLLLLLERLCDSEKVALCCTCRCLRDEQRRLRPALSYRPRMSHAILSAAWAAGWRVAHCHIDKKSGPLFSGLSGEHDNLLAEIENLSIVGRPDCALLVLSPFTDLASMTLLRVFELDSCAIGDAGVVVLAAAFRARALPALQILDLRRNRAQQARARPASSAVRTSCAHDSRDPVCVLRAPAEVTSSGAVALAEALAHHWREASQSWQGGGATLGRLTTLGLDCNDIDERGLGALALTLALGAAPALHSLFVDSPDHCDLQAVCKQRGVELSSW